MGYGKPYVSGIIDIAPCLQISAQAVHPQHSFGDRICIIIFLLFYI